MQDIIYLFPFEEIEKGSNIIIYGAGNVGQSFLGQIKMTGYCNVVAVADRAYDKYPYLGQKMIAPDDISKETFDKVVIAVDGDTRFQVMKEAVTSQGISEDLIVSGSGRLVESDSALSVESPNINTVNDSFCNDWTIWDLFSGEQRAYTEQYFNTNLNTS